MVWQGTITTFSLNHQSYERKIGTSEIHLYNLNLKITSETPINTGKNRSTTVLHYSFNTKSINKSSGPTETQSHYKSKTIEAKQIKGVNI